jgi:hypothetical protein
MTEVEKIALVHLPLSSFVLFHSRNHSGWTSTLSNARIIQFGLKLEY